ncbi:hypothetical protein PHLGIDRAFT_417792 [Phlebiopsis gigantea 11061_1 CR5-6]|uniref:Uncharacterized protein n=1 Tax=Phlebiopsis gigantea (strain 11061_1 CR5-6) TaxID=745531 RepID=A0A0C3S6J3_PHLG1|nr:hypothetical protein PHLGIDRAFT_417792 [Phlebiopsis gigantea 11061_1 CR5-6]
MLCVGETLAFPKTGRKGSVALPRTPPVMANRVLWMERVRMMYDRSSPLLCLHLRTSPSASVCLLTWVSPFMVLFRPETRYSCVDLEVSVA